MKYHYYEDECRGFANEWTAFKVRIGSTDDLRFSKRTEERDNFTRIDRKTWDSRRRLEKAYGDRMCGGCRDLTVD